MLPLAVPGLILAAGYVAMTRRARRLEADRPDAATRGASWSSRTRSAGCRSWCAACRPGWSRCRETLEEAARNLGIARAGGRARITLPLIAANVIAAGVLTFAFAMLEVSDSLILAQTPGVLPDHQADLRAGRTSAPRRANMAAALGVYGMGLLTATLIAANVLLGRKMGQLFRV